VATKLAGKSARPKARMRKHSRADQHHFGVFARTSRDTCCVRRVLAASRAHRWRCQGLRATMLRPIKELLTCVNQMQNVVPTFSRDHDRIESQALNFDPSLEFNAHDVRYAVDRAWTLLEVPSAIRYVHRSMQRCFKQV
jgi:hypothetical protein